jgi:Coiled-coil domain containing protein (DUF2052)
LQVAAFERLMRERFLNGCDHGFNYDNVDSDASLDHLWAKQETEDAQERYFDAD